MNSAYNGLSDHFGKALANRIYACAMLMPVYQSEGLDVAIRYTVGALKRMRQQGTKKTTWADVVDRLENEQVEGRHYSVATAFSQDVNRIETWNKQSEAEHKAANLVVQAMEAEAERYNNAPEEQLQVKLWIQEYMASLPMRKSAYLTRVMRHWRRGEELSRQTQRNLTVRYAPRGVGSEAFVELIAKYA